MEFQICVFFTLLILGREILSCGIITHIEIGHRAIQHFSDPDQKFTYQQLIRRHGDAYQAGNPYPDAYYSDICFQGNYHDISEDSHWSEFLNATVSYITSHYPKPWDQGTEKLVVFLLGYMSHQVADILWHNLGISQGFLQTMADVNFHGVFGTAHSAGDFGGDVLNQFELDLDYVGDLSEWYVPVDDLYQIYLSMYGKERLPRDVIVDCTTILFLGRLGEQVAVGKLYTEYARKSPFLQDQLSDYFVGGLDDMAAWTQIIWRNVITMLMMLEHGTSKCDVPHNPLYITCNNTATTDSHTYGQTGGGTNRQTAKESGIPLSVLDHQLTRDDIIVEKVHRGIRIRASNKLKDFIKQRKLKQRQIVQTQHTSNQREANQQNIKHLNNNKLKSNLLKMNNNKRFKSNSKMEMNNRLKSNKLTANFVYTVPEAYAKLGWSLAVGDLNNDSVPDLAVGAPGYGSEYAPQDGRVFIVYGTATGLPHLSDLSTQADTIITGPAQRQSRFGSSIAILDVNLDGVNDIAVGAPNDGSTTTPLKYNGKVYVYYGRQADKFKFSQINMTISCQHAFCTNGWLLRSGDINVDGHKDLILSSPFAMSPSGNEQRGFVGAVYASKRFKGLTSLSVDSLDWIDRGQQNYGWFGFDTKVIMHPDGPKILLVNQPTYRNCSLPACNYADSDLQGEGRLYSYHLPPGNSPAGLIPSLQHQQFLSWGASFDIGRPLPGKMSLLAVAATGEDIQGKIAGIKTDFTQAGSVRLLDVSNSTSPSLHQVALYAGDRRYGRFGQKVKFVDLNLDGLDDLIVTAPFRTEDVSEELYGGEEGRVYVYMGGADFPLGARAMFDCGDLAFIQPCPAYRATYELILGEERARFGYNIDVLKTNTTVSLLVTAIHSGHDQHRLSGAVAIFTFSKS